MTNHTYSSIIAILNPTKYVFVMVLPLRMCTDTTDKLLRKSNHIWMSRKKNKSWITTHQFCWIHINLNGVSKNSEYKYCCCRHRHRHARKIRWRDSYSFSDRIINRRLFATSIKPSKKKKNKNYFVFIELNKIYCNEDEIILDCHLNDDDDARKKNKSSHQPDAG